VNYEDRLRKGDYAVVPVSITAAERLVVAEHYARGASNTATYLDGLVTRSAPTRLLGVAWWLPPTRGAAEATYDGDFRLVLALSRFVIVEGVPKNAASFLLARSARGIRADGRFRCLVTYADEAVGHVGTIYRAAGWEYLGLTAAERRYLDADGRQVARQATKTRTRAEMEALGYRYVGSFRKHKYRLLLRESKVREGSLFRAVS